MYSFRNIYEQQAHNKRMTLIGVGIFIVFFLLLGFWFDGWTVWLKHNVSTIPVYLVPVFAVVLVYGFGSFLHTIHARMWYRLDPYHDFEETRRRSEKRLSIVLTLLFIGYCYIIVVWMVNLDSPRSVLFDDVFINSTFPWGTLLFLSVGVLYAYVVNDRGDRIIERAFDPFPPNAAVDEEKRLLNIVEEMSIAAGMDTLNSGIIEFNEPNAFAVGVYPTQSTILVTRGLLRKLSREELQAVVAHEIAHIRNRDTQLMTMITALYGSVLLLADWSRKDLVAGGMLTRSRLPKVKGVGGPLLFVFALLATFLAPFFARVLALGISRQREYLADAGAAELTRNPTALAHALTKLQNENNWASPVFRSVAHLCIVDPSARPMGKRNGILAEWLSTHPPTAHRIMLLNSLSYRYIAPSEEERTLPQS